MARKRKPLPLLENITIEAVAARVKATSHEVDDQVVFGRLILCARRCCRLAGSKEETGQICEAKVVRFIKKSEVRQ